jgi:AAA domain
MSVTPEEEAKKAAFLAARRAADQQDAKPNGQAPPVDLTKLCLTPSQWKARDIPTQDRLLGDLLSTTTRSMLSADTGLGKTMLGLAFNFAMRLKADFLHWKAHREARVLIVDGEMPGELIQSRIAVAASWFGVGASDITDGLYLLSREDVEDMPPLDTSEGARWLLDFISKLGKIDHATFGNIASLTASCLKEEDGARALKDLQLQLTKLHIGQLWEHHTGHDTTRAYGPKMRSWHLDTDMMGERVDQPDTDVALVLKFTKARRRTPENRANFEELEITLAQGRWEYKPTKGGKRQSDKDKPLGSNQKIVLDAATKIIAGSTTKAPPGSPAGGKTAVKIDVVKDETRRLMACETKHFNTRFQEALNALTSARRLQYYDGWVWL